MLRFFLWNLAFFGKVVTVIVVVIVVIFFFILFDLVLFLYLGSSFFWNFFFFLSFATQPYQIHYPINAKILVLLSFSDLSFSDLFFLFIFGSLERASVRACTRARLETPYRTFYDLMQITEPSFKVFNCSALNSLPFVAIAGVETGPGPETGAPAPVATGCLALLCTI